MPAWPHVLRLFGNLLTKDSRRIWVCSSLKRCPGCGAQVVSEAAMRLPEEVYRAEAKGTPRADEELTREERRRRRAKKKRSHKSRTAQQACPKLWLFPNFKRLLGDCMPLSSSSSAFGQSKVGLRRGCQQHYERMQKARKAAIDGCSSVLMIVGSKCFLIAAICMC